MEPVTVIALLVAGLGIGVSAFLAVSRGKAEARAAAAEATLAAVQGQAGAEAERLRGEVASLREQVEGWRATAAEKGSAAAALDERLALQEKAHDAAVDQMLAMHRQELDAAGRIHTEQLAAVRQAKAEIEKKLAEFDQKTQQVFGAMAAEALKSSSEQFLKLAKESLAAQSRAAEAEIDKRREAVDRLVQPIAETLAKTDAKLQEIEKERTASFSSLKEQIRGISLAHETLRAETGKLVRALSKPEVRGRYGEIQLRRVAELAGMVGYCDFCEQGTTRTSDGRAQRPDMTVKLPNDRLIAVDAKTNTQAYIDACDAAGEGDREAHLERFAKHVADQVTALARKTYWAEFKGSPEFVVMFIPGDQFLDAALARRPDLLDFAAEQNVILASPATLIGLLRAVAVGWREKSVADQAAELLKLGGELHERVATLYEHIADLGKALGTSVEKYNKMVGSYDARLTPTLKRFEQAGARSAKVVPELAQVTVLPRRASGALDGVQQLDGFALPPGRANGER